MIRFYLKLYLKRTKSGTQGNLWRRGQVNIVSEREFSVVIEGDLG